MAALDPVVAQEEDALPVGDELPLKVGRDVPGAPAENPDPALVGRVIVGHDDVG